MKKKGLLLILIALMLASCASTEDAPAYTESGAEAGKAYEPAIFFFTRDAGIVTLETIDGAVYMTVPRFRTYLSPMDSYVSADGSPIFASTAEGVNIKVYADAALWMRNGRAEYTAWNFTESPKDFYVKL